MQAYSVGRVFGGTPDECSEVRQKGEFQMERQNVIEQKFAIASELNVVEEKIRESDGSLRDAYRRVEEELEKKLEQLRDDFPHSEH